jgi:outer membrane immunogenic protein
MDRKFLLACFSAFCFAAQAALAADLGYAPPPAYLPPPLFTWTGLYVGGQIGYAWGSSAFDASGFDPVTGAAIGGPLGSNPGGVIGGAHAGYQYQFNQLVLGIEGSVDGTSLTSTGVAALSIAFGGSTLTASTSADVQGSIRGKIGLALDRVLVYVTGGVAFGGSNTTFALAAPNLAPPIFATASTSATRTGWTAGGGLEYSVTNNWWVFAEYRFTDFGTLQSDFLTTELPAGSFLNGERRLQDNQVQAGFSYRFDTYAPVPAVPKY